MARANKVLRQQLHYTKEHNDKLLGLLQTLTDRTDQLAAEYRQLQTDLALKELYKGATDEYLQAINAAKSGADAAEIADSFGMINSEAELIVSIHGAHKQVA
ncbi:MAG: DUF2802 domain-containing protein [Gammaproteobacteria bacterium]|nr:DUF2802 domain-containing protein [Gammaproteobacteria bacterium]